MFGALAYHALPVSDLPNIDYPTLTVSASLPGADPATIPFENVVEKKVVLNHDVAAKLKIKFPADVLAMEKA